MLNVTTKAVDHLATLLERYEAEPQQALRLVSTAPGTLGLKLDEPLIEDDVITQDQRPVLLLDPQLSVAMDGSSLDAVDSPEGERLVLKPRPDAN